MIGRDSGDETCNVQRLTLSAPMFNLNGDIPIPHGVWKAAVSLRSKLKWKTVRALPLARASGARFAR